MSACLSRVSPSFVSIVTFLSVHTQTLHLHHLPHNVLLQDDDTSSIRMQNNNANQVEANDGEWAEFENFQHPVDSQQPADIDIKLPIDDKKEVSNQLPQVETQMSFKVDFFVLISLPFIAFCLSKFAFIFTFSLNSIAILGSNK